MVMLLDIYCCTRAYVVCNICPMAQAETGVPPSKAPLTVNVLQGGKVKMISGRLS